ncbi:2-phosphosulfolactate phosphatase [Agromyces marinus]|uniref:2-phosphosulfolactate phosphatase n=1 Tax=Agromyces marinus TaxID=1389020 RepID=A0ABM8H3T5_9MICO|nr:2-phosphosulfolactate phosphatase [Agromyces marinus]UIP59484.1 hypothetical protein DSM26151_23910 [Agromyces marinus]BDZ55468.1 hypothetical protein GCM10025870_25410 [Agromyces marinus]
MSEQSPAAPAAQQRYQVRFDVGVDGARRVAEGADVLVWADQTRADASGPAIPADVLVLAPRVVEAGLADAAAVAAWILDEQERLGRRAYVAIVAAGRADAGFAADDVLAAGAVVDALTGLGIDDTSPEAAVACAAFAGLRRAVAHLATASVEGREAASAGVDPAALRRAAQHDATATARVLTPR